MLDLAALEMGPFICGGTSGLPPHVHLCDELGFRIIFYRNEDYLIVQRDGIEPSYTNAQRFWLLHTSTNRKDSTLRICPLIMRKLGKVKKCNRRFV